jgi:hypothetical protein
MNIAAACEGTKTIGTDRLGPSVHFAIGRMRGLSMAK